MLGGAFICMICPRTQRMLLGKRNTDTEWSPGTWFSFGGTIEPGESPRKTAVREFLEETKIAPNEYSLSLEPIYMEQNKDNNGDLHTIHMYAGKMNSELIPEIDSESQDWKWFKLSDIPHLNTHPVLKNTLKDQKAINEIKILTLIN